MTGKNRRHYHCKALNSLLCADVPLRNYSLTHSFSLSVHSSARSLLYTSRLMSCTVCEN